MDEGDILGHEPMGIVEEVGSEVDATSAPATASSIPFNISCGHCCMCGQRPARRSARRPRCASTARARRCSATRKLYGQVPGGQAEYLRVPQAQFGPIKVPDGPPDERFVYLSDVLPTAWQAVEYADVPDGGTLVVFGLGPIGQMAARIALHRGAGRVIGVDLVPERLALARAARRRDDRPARQRRRRGRACRELTDGRGPDAVIDAVGMEAHGAPVGKLAQNARRAAAGHGRPEADREGRRRPPGGAARGDRAPCAAAGRSRSPASTAAWSTRCR